MKTAYFILYVKNQEASMHFYSKVLAKEPRLHVTGMSEFELRDGSVLGLMPESGIKRLLGDPLPDPSTARGIPRGELYLLVENAAPFHERSLRYGARELSPLLARDWGHRAAYSLDADGHVLAFAEEIKP